MTWFPLQAGPVEADPLLCTMVESSLENGRYEVATYAIHSIA